MKIWAKAVAIMAAEAKTMGNIFIEYNPIHIQIELTYLDQQNSR